MRASTAYFAGAGTVIVAIVAGVGGGLLMADVISPKSSKQGNEMSRLERRMSTEPIQAATPSESVPHQAAPAAPVTTVAAGPAQTSGQTQTEAVNSTPTPNQPVDTSASAKPEAPAPQPAATQQTATTEDAVAKARDADVKRAEEKRKSERRQQLAEKRRQRHQQELRAVAERVREDTLPRQEFAAEPMPMEMPQIRLFGTD